MKKIILIAFILTLVMVICGCNNSNRLTIYTWDEMFPQDILRRFERDTGIKINYVNFDTDETMLARLQASKGGNYEFNNRGRLYY